MVIVWAGLQRQVKSTTRPRHNTSRSRAEVESSGRDCQQRKQKLVFTVACTRLRNQGPSHHFVKSRRGRWGHLSKIQLREGKQFLTFSAQEAAFINTQPTHPACLV
jgi:hypothetical protein